jgi:serine/threonine protein kinase
MPVLPMVGDEFAGYRLRAVVGRGGMSVVYQAENPRLGSVVALKVLAPEIATDDVFRARFLEESRIAASLNHPNVIPIYDMGPCDDLLYIAMRYVAGTDLRALLKKHSPLPPADSIFLTGQAARALDAAHRKGLVHRDVKPGNLLIEHGQDGDPDHVYLSDFGITKYMLSRSGLTKTGEFLGTIDYVAPEQIQETPVDGRADEYSLGCVLYECLTGRVPFPKERDAAIIWAHVEEMPPPPSALQPELPAAVDDVFSRVLAKKPDDRYATCREFVDAARVSLGVAATQTGTSNQARTSNTATVLRAQHSGPSHPEVISQRGSVPPPAAGGQAGRDEPPPGSHGRQPRKRWRWVAAVAAAVILIGAGVGIYLGTRSNNSASKGHGGGMPMQHTALSASYSPLDRALILANQSALSTGSLQPKFCRNQSTTIVTCTNPTLAISSVTFHTYPTLTALYAAYEAKVESIMPGPFMANVANCGLLAENGEISWNHDYLHLATFSMAQSIQGNLNPDSQAAGRMFCHFVASDSQEVIVWTQNAGRVLGVVSGSPHPDVYQWWYGVHHDIAMAGSPAMQMPASSPSPSMHMSTPTPTMSMSSSP